MEDILSIGFFFLTFSTETDKKNSIFLSLKVIENLLIYQHAQNFIVLYQY